MTRRARAFATLAAVGLLVLTAALIAGALLGSQQLLLSQSRAQKNIEARAIGWKETESILTALQTSWNPDELGLDSWWAAHSHDFPSGCVLISLSARLNLNSISPFLLKDSELSASLLGHSVEDFINYRMNKGPFARIEDYKDYFQPAALGKLFCVHSLFCVNTADEIVLEKILAARTGSESLASSIRSRLREYRSNKQILTEADWETLVGAEKSAIGDLASVCPELDVNTAPVELLQALLRDPDYKLEHADAKVQAILTGRQSKPWTDEGLRASLGLEKNAPLLQYLGTRSRFIQGSLPSGNEVMEFVALVSYSSDTPPKVSARIIETRWVASS